MSKVSETLLNSILPLSQECHIHIKWSSTVTRWGISLSGEMPSICPLVLKT